MRDFSPDTGDPFDKARQHRTAWYKRAIYCVARPFLSFRSRRMLSQTALALPHLSLVLPERGFPLETRRLWLSKYATVRGQTMLVAGTGTGWDALSWLPLGPRRVLGMDSTEFRAAWRRLSQPRLRFIASDLERLPLSDGSVDLVASDAVFEHCRDLDAVLRELRRVLRPGGTMYATYGPLWYCFAGDHFSGRGGLTHGYRHVEAEPGEYRDYVAAHLREHEDAQSGGRYIGLDLFSRLTTRGYLAAFARAGFDLLDLRLEISADALHFREHWPDRALAICSRHDVSLDDLVIKANFVILRRR